MQHNNSRLNYLDSLRGIAALIVVFSHFALMAPDDVSGSVQSVTEALHSLSNSGFYLLVKIHMAARAAVILFFILSGFVLARSLENGKTPFIGYVVKRFFRIYPVLFFTVIISFLLHKKIGFSHEVFSSWLRKTCDPDMSLKTLLKNLLLWGTKGANSFDGVIWSLVYELRISIFFPFILWSINKFKLKAVLSWLLLSIASTFYVHHISGGFVGGFGEATFALTLLDTIYFVVFFAVGAYLSINSKLITFYLTKLPIWLIVLFSASVAYSFLKTDSGGMAAAASDYIKGFGATVLIALAISFKKFESSLNLKIPMWTGRISYSLYLIHMPIIYVVTQTIGTVLTLPEIAIVVLLASLVAAQIMANLIEFPVNNLGKALSKTLVAFYKPRLT